MLLASLLLTTRLLPGAATAPPQATPADTTTTVRGLFNQPFSWGTLVLRDGRRLQGYLPPAASADGTLTWYERAPGSKPKGKIRFCPLSEVQAMLVKGQHYTVLSSPAGLQLAARRQMGAAELYATRPVVAPITSFLGSAPVMGLPASTPGQNPAPVWLLRRPTGAEFLQLAPQSFATQLAAFLADDKELAAKVAAGAAGYRFEDVESIITQYNQRAGKQ